MVYRYNSLCHTQCVCVEVIAQKSSNHSTAKYRLDNVATGTALKTAIENVILPMGHSAIITHAYTQTHPILSPVVGLVLINISAPIIQLINFIKYNVLIICLYLNPIAKLVWR